MLWTVVLLGGVRASRNIQRYEGLEFSGDGRRSKTCGSRSAMVSGPAGGATGVVTEVKVIVIEQVHYRIPRFKGLRHLIVAFLSRLFTYSYIRHKALWFQYG